MPDSPVYIELHAASAFSFLQGASLPETLVERAAALGYPALALLDADGVYGAPRFHKAAKQAGLRAIIGAELTIQRQRAAGSGQPSSGAGQAAGSRQHPHCRPPAAGCRLLRGACPSSLPRRRDTRTSVAS